VVTVEVVYELAADAPIEIQTALGIRRPPLGCR
jgi:hypothetical protein